MQGRSMKPLFDGKQHPWRKSFLYEYFRENWYPGIPLILGVRTEDMKYVCYPDIKDLDEMYDLDKDPIEMKNLAQDPAHAGELNKLKAEFEKAKKESGYPEGKQLGAPPV